MAEIAPRETEQELTDKDIATLIEQVKWARYHDGGYNHYDPILITRRRLREMQEDDSIQLNGYDIGLLLQALRTSQHHFWECHQEGKMVLPETEETVSSLYQKLYGLFCKRSRQGEYNA